MFLNKWTVQLSCPGQIVEQAFDSEEELLAFIRSSENGEGECAAPMITVIDPEGNEKSLAAIEVSGQRPV